jgi:hypothetical protein
MKASSLWFSAAIVAIAVVVLTVPASAFADTYQIYDLGDGNGFGIYGIDDSGTVVISNNHGGPTYDTWVNGSLVNTSPTVPTLVFDNGTPCSPSLAAGMTVVGHTSCNNGFEVFGGEYLGGSRGIYTGPDPTDFLQNGTVDALVLNAYGDFAWTDGFHEENFEAIDLSTVPTPEPSSLILLGTGVLAAAGTMRRRLI